MMQVVANQKFIETRRKTVSFSVSDTQNIQIWETQVIKKIVKKFSSSISFRVQDFN
jgi:hypothetical protein